MYLQSAQYETKRVDTGAGPNKNKKGNKRKQRKVIIHNKKSPVMETSNHRQANPACKDGRINDERRRICIVKRIFKFENAVLGFLDVTTASYVGVYIL